MRLFLAIDPPPDLRRDIAADIRRLADDQGRWWGGVYARWANEANLHLTVRFIGEVDQQTCAALADGFRKIEPAGPVSLVVEGPLLFPPRGAVRIIGRAVGGDVEALQGYRNNVDAVCDALGLPSDGRPLNPHLTLARMNRGPIPDRRALLAYPALASLAAGSFVATESILYESVATGSGQIYKAMDRFAL